MDKEKLEKYESKRNFKKTDEPDGKVATSNDKPIFVIQKHDASSLHYDFRMEYEGILKSWALPKGPSTDPSVKRLAIPTEDHPIQYADFEGIIPEGEYGAGRVIVWDTGPYENISEKDGKKISLDDAIEKGHIVISLDGEKLKGGYAFIRTEKGDDERWLFIKTKDEHADARRNPVSTEPKSVISNKKLEDL